MKTLLPLFALSIVPLSLSTACVVKHRFPAADSDTDAASTTSSSEATFGTDGASSSPSPTGVTSSDDGVQETDGAGGAWPPDDGFDPIPDVAQGTLDDDMIVLVDTPQGRLPFWFHAERAGYGVTGSISAAEPAPAGSMPLWTSVGLAHDIDYNGVEGNEFGIILQTFDLVEGGPYGDSQAELVFNLRLYSDRLMCGTVNIDIPGGEFLADLPVVVWRMADVTDPDPAFECEEP